MKFFGGMLSIILLITYIKMVMIYALFDQYGMHYYINMICYLFQDREIRSDDMT